MLKRAGAALIAMTGQKGSTLARQAAAVLDTHVEEEACPLNLAPTSSTTATLALGDALAVALLKARGLTPEEFARTHPGGRLGRRLLVSVADVMRTGSEIPRVGPEASLAEGLLEMSRKGLGMTAITDQAGRPLGVFTDGDLRRAMDREADLKATRMAEVMNPGRLDGNPRNAGVGCGRRNEQAQDHCAAGGVRRGALRAPSISMT